MEDPGLSDASILVYYRPIEAAIRWSGLLQFQSSILAMEKLGELPSEADIPGWTRLLLNLGRIRDALIHDELKYGLNGVTCHDPGLLAHPDLTVRHVDLKAWMSWFYPDQRPGFLFDAVERQQHPGISVEAIQVLMADREALRLQLADCKKTQADLQLQVQASPASPSTGRQPGRPFVSRSERTYLNIVGGLLWLLLGASDGGGRNSVFETQEAIVNALTTQFGGQPGMSARTLWAKFAAARRSLDDA